MRFVRKELMAYNTMAEDRADIVKRLYQMDSDIRPNISNLDGMPKAQGGLPKSTVENEVIHRETSRQRVMDELELLDRRIAVIKKALSVLDPLELSIINRTFLSLDWERNDIANSLELTLSELDVIKNRALTIIGYALGLETV
ncbi:hypothetical protein [Paenibacillus sp. CMAA1364]